jgi:Protein of unknown function (DUF3592)
MLGDYLKILLYVIWAAFFIAVALTMIHTMRKTRRQEQLIANWPKARATVTGSRRGWTHGGGNTTRNVRYWPAYQFHDHRGVLYAGESEASYRNPPVHGSSLEVAYNPEDPNQSFQVASPSKMVIGCLIPAFTVLALGSFWYIGIFPLA